MVKLLGLLEFNDTYNTVYLTLYIQGYNLLHKFIFLVRFLHIKSWFEFIDQKNNDLRQECL